MKFQQIAKQLGERHKWISQIEFDIDERLLRVCHSGVTEMMAGNYNEHDLDMLLSSASALAERCLLYRREVNEILAAAIQRALDYDLLDKQRDFKSKLEEAAWNDTVKQAESNAHRAAKAVFDQGTDPLSKGFATASGGNLSVTETIQEVDRGRRALVQQKWSAEREHLDVARSLHSTDGHPLNFAQRASRVLGYLEHDFKLGLAKSRACKPSLEAVGIDEKLIPSEWEAEPLDTWFAWLQGVTREREAKLSRSVLYHYSEAASANALEFSLSNENRTILLRGAEGYMRGPNAHRERIGLRRLISLGASLVLKSDFKGVDPRLVVADLALRIKHPTHADPERYITLSLRGASIEHSAGSVAELAPREATYIDPFDDIRSIDSIVVTDVRYGLDKPEPDVAWISDVVLHATFEASY